MFEQIIKDKANVYFLIVIVGIYALSLVIGIILGYFGFVSGVQNIVTTVLGLLMPIIFYLITSKEKGLSTAAFVLSITGLLLHIAAIKTNTELLSSFILLHHFANILFAFMLMKVNSPAGRMMFWGLLIYAFFWLCEPILNNAIIAIENISTLYIVSIITAIFLTVIPLVVMSLGVILHLLSFTKIKEIPVKE